jgi:hypothetical protein
MPVMPSVFRPRKSGAQTQPTPSQSPRKPLSIIIAHKGALLLQIAIKSHQLFLQFIFSFDFNIIVFTFVFIFVHL